MRFLLAAVLGMAITFSLQVPQAHAAETAGAKASKAPVGEGCACGSAKVCVGKRGGRYCITRSGGKRYGV